MMLTRMFHKLTSRNLSTLICVLLILGATLGCKKIQEFANKKADDNSPPTRETPINTGGIGEDNALVKKTNFYITECFNKYSNRVVESHNRYAQWVKDLEQGPTGKEMNIYGLYDVNGDGSDCEKAVESAKQSEPSMPDVEAVADKYVVALKDVIKNIRDVYKYYEQEDYKDDNFAKGKAAHPALIASFKGFKDINTEFAAAVDKLEDQVAESELAKLKDDPSKRYEFLIVESGVKAKKVKNLLQAKDFDQITADELTPLIEDFEKTVEALRTEPSKKTMGDSYVRSCDEFTKATKEMMRRKRDNKPFTDTERRQIAMGAGWMVDGSPAKIIKAYNDMIFQRRFTRF